MIKKTLDVVIIDDEITAITYLTGLLLEIGNINIVASFTNPNEALPVLKNSEIVVFLDINLNEISGIEFTKKISNRVIFTTAHTKYAVESFEYQNTIDYLVKPIYHSRILKAINKLLNLNMVEKYSPDLEYLTLNSNEQSLTIDYASIDYIEAIGHSVIIYSNGDTEDKVMAPLTLREIEKMLPSNGFIRVHKSYVVNKFKFVDKTRTEIKLLGGIFVPLGKAYRDTI